MTRLMLTDERWSKLRTIMREHGIYDKRNLRMTVQGILYRMRVGCPWRDMPSIFGYWNSIFQQFNRWSLKDKLDKIFKSLVQEPDLEWEFIDGSIVKAHQHSTGAPSGGDEAIGKSVAVNTTKNHMSVDACAGGEVHDCKIAPEFFTKLTDADYMIADNDYDSEELRDLVRAKSLVPVIPKKIIQKQETMI